MPRGGRRQGTPGAKYSNRSDLRAHKLPVQTAPGQAYGAAKAQADSQAAVPIASGQLAPPTQGPALSDAQNDMQNYAGPSTPVVPIGAPTMNPNEPVTAGVGAPPAAAPQPGDDPVLRGVALLNSLGSNVPPQVQALRNAANAQQANTAAP